MFARSLLGSVSGALRLSTCKAIASKVCVANVHTLNHIPILNANMEKMQVYLEPSSGEKPKCSVRADFASDAVGYYATWCWRYW